MADLYNPLRSYRVEGKLSVKDLADLIDLSRSEMLAVEEGRRTISLAQRDALAQRLKVAPEKLAYLVGRDCT